VPRVRIRLEASVNPSTYLPLVTNHYLAISQPSWERTLAACSPQAEYLIGTTGSNTYSFAWEGEFRILPFVSARVIYVNDGVQGWQSRIYVSGREVADGTALLCSPLEAIFRVGPLGRVLTSKQPPI
jgi:hypothetical protein